ncbi:MAG TPA: hypothetical protein GXX59_11135 [Syntrophomonadaceae bacterium]|nr:hypothetical protein [Syntrophomonadaceae bacterium]
MGFLHAAEQLGSMEQSNGLEPYLMFPFGKEGKIIMVYLDVADPNADVLDIQGIKKMELADHKDASEMKLKYLYRKKAGSNIKWGFSPIHFIGRPKKNTEKNRELLIGDTGNWVENTKTHFNKIRNRLLQDYEKEGAFAEGSVDNIMTDMEVKVEAIVENWVSNEPHLIIFGADKDGEFLYPGEIPAFVYYFQKKIKQSLIGKKSMKLRQRCTMCGKVDTGMTTLSKVFKFSTADKVNFLPGLDKKLAGSTFPICTDCFEKISAGRERIERLYSNSSVIPGLHMWVIPEAVGGEDDEHFKYLIVNKMDQQKIGESLTTLGDIREERYLSRLAREGQGLIFHFLFLEKIKAQELVHLMVEDVPPERLAFLEAKWKEAMTSVFGDVSSGLALDWAVKSLYITLSKYAGQSKGDRIVMRDFTIRTLGKMLRGERLPVATFKGIIVSRAACLVYETPKWDDVKKNMLYAQVWVEFMQRVNEGVA